MKKLCLPLVLLTLLVVGACGAPQVQPSALPATEASRPQPTAEPGLPAVQVGNPRADVPLMVNATNVVAAASGGEYSLVYQAPGALNTAISFYETEMPRAGWRYDSAQTTVVAGFTAALFFDKEGERATVSLTSQGTGVLVVIDVE